jgi:hypothetical protein
MAEMVRMLMSVCMYGVDGVLTIALEFRRRFNSPAASRRMKNV